MANALILKELIERLKIPIGDFERIIDVKDTRISTAIARNSKIKSEVVDKIINAYPNINRDWLETGAGEMFIRKNNDNPTGILHVSDEVKNTLNENITNELPLEPEQNEGNNMTMLQALIQSNRDQAQAVRDMAKAHLILSELLQSRYGEDGELKKASGM